MEEVPKESPDPEPKLTEYSENLPLKRVGRPDETVAMVYTMRATSPLLPPAQ